MPIVKANPKWVSLHMAVIDSREVTVINPRSHTAAKKHKSSRGALGDVRDALDDADDDHENEEDDYHDDLGDLLGRVMSEGEQGSRGELHHGRPRLRR